MVTILNAYIAKESFYLKGAIVMLLQTAFKKFADLFLAGYNKLNRKCGMAYAPAIFYFSKTGVLIPVFAFEFVSALHTFAPLKNIIIWLT